MVSGPSSPGSLPVPPVDQSMAIQPPAAPTPSSVQRTPPLPSQTPIPGGSAALTQTNGTDRVQISESALDANAAPPSTPDTAAPPVSPPGPGGVLDAPIQPVVNRPAQAAPASNLAPPAPPPPAPTGDLQPPGQHVDMTV